MSDGLYLPEQRVRLAALPTPLESAPNLSKALGINLLIKRDDLTGLAMGGNKVRQLEYLIADALAGNATMILATAAAQSNFCRMATAAARRVGLRIGLLLRGTPNAEVQGNLLLDRVLGADIRFVDNYDPYAPLHQEQLQAWAEEETRHGERPYVVNLHNGSRMGALMTCGYVAASLELGQQCHEVDVRPDHLYLAIGSGSTLAGLSIGTRIPASGLSETRLAGVSVGTPAEAIVPRIREFIHSTTALLGLPDPTHDHFTVDDSQRGPHYGVPTAASLEAIYVAGQSEALLLNPVYTGKAFASLMADVSRGIVRSGETVIFLNTGGDPLLFSYSDVVAQSALREATSA